MRDTVPTENAGGCVHTRGLVIRGEERRRKVIITRELPAVNELAVRYLFANEGPGNVSSNFRQRVSSRYIDVVEDDSKILNIGDSRSDIYVPD